jgi:hypothetical protein
LGIVTVISVPLALLTSSNPWIATLGFFLLPPLVLGCANYLWSGWRKMEWGILIGMVALAPLCATIAVLWGPF